MSSSVHNNLEFKVLEFGACVSECCLTHERSCAADEAEKAALGRKSSTFTTRHKKNKHTEIDSESFSHLKHTRAHGDRRRTRACSAGGFFPLALHNLRRGTFFPCGRQEVGEEQDESPVSSPWIRRHGCCRLLFYYFQPPAVHPGGRHGGVKRSPSPHGPTSAAKFLLTLQSQSPLSWLPSHFHIPQGLRSRTHRTVIVLRIPLSRSLSRGILFPQQHLIKNFSHFL